ncbi:Zinc finger protein 358 [Metarhizium anisopliae]
MSFDCIACDRSFGSEEALEQHLRDAPVHAPSFECSTCDRSFGSEEALEQHLRDAPVHAPSFECSACDRSFGSEEALEQHLRDAPACDRSFGSEEALAQHLRDSRAHTQAAETPLDIFFRSFPDFDYNPSLPPATTYAYLRQHEGWRRGDVDSTDAWDRYQDALESELRMWYGSEDDLTAWHALCRAIGVNPLPKTCKHCEEV